MPDILRFFHSQFFVTPPKPTTDLTGKTVIVTGSNVGLGKEAARHFTSLNASTVILAVRSLEKGEAARADIEATTGRKDVVKVMQLDMSSYASVLDFASRAAKDLDRLDIAVLNAGIIRGSGVWEVYEQDESTITVNVVSTFLLAFALLPKMRETAGKFNTRPTLTVVSSEVHGWATFDERKAPEGGIFARLNEKVVDGKNVSLAAKIFAFFMARTTEVGSRTLVHAGLQGEESHGKYFSDCQVTEPSPYVRSEEGKRDQGRVWKELVEKLEGIKEGVTQV
ncbi:hypothetical protein CFE70_008519 [Pyrenophora teres f. teres 0-1]